MAAPSSQVVPPSVSARPASDRAAVWGHAPEPAEVARRLDCRLQVVLGKGGVGRTLVASAIAKRAADAGHRTLLLEVDAPDDAAQQLRVKAAIDHPREVLNNLWLCRMTPAGAMKEYALLTLRFQTLYRLVFENRLVKYLLRSIPSLGEFTMLGKVWYHATETQTRGPHAGALRFDRVIVDAPATGHAITFFSLARLVANVAPPGLMADASTKMADLIENANATCYHVVTLAEEMPVNEAVELHEAGQARLRMSPGIAVVNRLRPPLFSDAEYEAIAAVSPGDDGAVVKRLAGVASRRKIREDTQRAHLARFVEKTGLPWLGVTEQADFGHTFVDEVAAQLDALTQGAAGGVER